MRQKQHSVKHGKTNDVQQQVQQSQGEEMNVAKANREGWGGVGGGGTEYSTMRILQ